MPISVGVSGPRRALGALGALWLGCGLPGGEPPSPEEPKPVSVELARVEAELLRDVSMFSGQLGAENSVVVKAETDGVIDQVLFEEGQEIEAGGVLFQLRDEEQVARLREAKANLAQARAVYDRTHKLVARDAASAAKQDESAAQLAVARARVDLAQLAYQRTRIRAPFDGVLGMRLVSPGDRITDEVPLVQIDAVSRLQLSFPISEDGIRFARVGLPIEIKVGPYPGEVFPGEVFFVSPTLDPAARRIIVKAWVPNADRRLRAGLFANVDMEVARRENAILVPESAVVFDRQGTYVWRVSDGDVAQRVPVETGLRKGGRVEVTLGLQPGDRIVTAGTHKVSEGKRVVAAAPARDAQGQARRAPPGGEEVGEGT
jgi:membrane fusion protein (multidrug efflux system)